MLDETANEADVREEIAAPLLKALGYSRGSANDILRELSLSYDRNFLGRKKKSDPPIRGRADYVLSVAGVARWTFEIKAPSSPIDVDTIEQAISYARHPEVSGYYAAAFDGKHFVLYANNQKATDEPIIKIEFTSLEELVKNLEGSLSPEAIRRDCAPKIIDTGTPLASGYRSKANIKGGMSQFSHFSWNSNATLPPANEEQLEEACRRIRSMRTTIIGGEIRRDDYSRIRAKLEWAIPAIEMQTFIDQHRLMDMEYICLSEVISSDAECPSTFDVVGDFEVSEGDELFDIIQWETQVAGLPTHMSLRGQAIGHLDEYIFHGLFQAEYRMTFPNFPGMEINAYGVGRFEVEIDTN